jgi:hypothetical protein
MQPTKQNPPTQHAAPTGQNTMKGTNTMTAENGQLALQKTQPVEIQLDQHGVQLRSFDEMGRFCKAVVNSTLAPKSFDTPEKVMVAIQAGMEVGLAPMQALQSIAVVNGKPCIFGDAALALAMRHPEFEDIDEVAGTDKATCTIKRRGRTPCVRTFSMEDAKRAKLTGRDGPWQQYPQRMLQMRARSWALRDSFPDALRGFGVTEEVRDYSPRNVTTRKVAEGVVLPEVTTAAEFFDSAAEPSQRAALNDKATGELFAEVVK